MFRKKKQMKGIKIFQNDDDFKYFIGYLHDDDDDDHDHDHDVIRPLWIILPQMSLYRKYSNNGGKNISLKI